MTSATDALPPASQSIPSAPVPAVDPEPDTKDWTWVLERRCPECGFAAADVAASEIAATLRDLVPRWVSVLHRPDARVRPAPATWSALEYGAHVRDVMRVFGTRVQLMVEQDDPVFENWDQDATALADRYDQQDPVVVADELAEAAEVTAARFDAVGDDAWDRTGLRANGSAFTVRTLGQYFLHDPVHHLHDVRG
ncbi:DinB family protein [Cellulomonas soli]|uniref:DinB family protein n=1 Tax=Cellulomonas soli TaxID=931535 RepID=UPI003F829999